MSSSAHTPSCNSDARGGAWYDHVTLDDVVVSAAADGTSVASRIMDVSVARIAYKDLRAICAKLAVAGYKNKRKADMARMIADKKAAARPPSERAAVDRGLVRRPATPAAEKAGRLCLDYPRVMAGTVAHSFLVRGGHHDGCSPANRVAAVYNRPPRVELQRVPNGVGASPYVVPSCAAVTHRCEFVSPQRVVVPIQPGRGGFGCQAITDSPQAARQLVVDDDNCSTSGSSSNNSDDIRFVTPSSQESSSTQDPVTPEPVISVVKDDENASLNTWFKVSDRIAALRSSLKTEGDTEIAGEIKDDIAFLVRKKRRITKAL